jgi:hypothetical protein
MLLAVHTTGPSACATAVAVNAAIRRMYLASLDPRCAVTVRAEYRKALHHSLGQTH